MPADVTFSVYMDTTGTGAEEGVFVGLIHSTTGGSITKTFDIPSSLYDRSKIDLRVESDAAQLSAFVTFENGD